MQKTPFISFADASENRRAAPEDLKLPDFARIVNFYVDVNGRLTCPIPDFTYPDEPDPPCAIPAPVTTYVDWMAMGAYIIALGVNSNGRRIWWCAPGRPAVWDLTETVDGVLVRTGAGWRDLPGDGDITHGIGMGQIGAIYDENGVGQISMSGQWQLPFSYAKRTTSTQTYSGVFDSLVDGMSFTLDQSGLLYASDGAGAQPVNGPLNLLAMEDLFAWPPAADALLSYDDDTRKLWAKVTEGLDEWEFLIAPESARYTAKYGADIYLETGALGLVDDKSRTHFMYAEIHTNVTTEGPTIKLKVKGIDEVTWRESSEYLLPEGAGVTRVTLNEMIEGDPQMQIVLDMQGETGDVQLLGMRIGYNPGGED